MAGPMNVAVRFVIFRLCVPVFACSVTFVSVGLPNGNQPCAVPSSQSFCIGPVNADETVCVVSVSAVSGAASQLRPPATHNDIQPRNNDLAFIVCLRSI